MNLPGPQETTIYQSINVPASRARFSYGKIDSFNTAPARPLTAESQAVLGSHM